jgi:hypothetical protein
MDAATAKPETYSKEDRAVVVLAAEHRSTSGIFGETTYPSTMIFALKRPVMVEEDGERLPKRFVQFRGPTRTSAYSLPPGDYALVSLDTFISTGARASYQSRGWDPRTGTYEVFGFSIEPGEVVYLGRVVSRDEIKKEGLFLSVEDQPDEARLAVHVAFPGEVGNGLVEKMKIELLKVPPKAW